MAHYQNSYNGRAMTPPAVPAAPGPVDWSGEIAPLTGESAALLFTAGFAHALNGFIDGLSSSGATLTVALYVYAKEQGQFEVAFVIAAILLVMSLIINLMANLVGARLKSRAGKKAK